MTRDEWSRDLRTADDIVMFTGDALREDPQKSMIWRCIYGLAVIVEHILIEKVRGLDRGKD